MRTVSIRRTGVITLLAAVLGIALAMVVGGSVDASSVTPTVVAGNPSCTDLGYSFGFKPQPEPPPAGTYFFGDPVTSPAHPPTGDSITISSDGTFFDWSSTLGLDALIVKGGANAHVYVYEPPAESFGDTVLNSPINPNTHKPFAISHIEFCYDFEVDVTKTAETTFTRTYEWKIEKSVTPSEWYLFTGDTGASEYTVAATKTGFTDSDWAVSGAIWVENNTPFDATIESVADVISGPIHPAVTCPPLPTVLGPGDSLHCTYTSPLPDGAERTNTATVTTSGPVHGGEAAAVARWAAGVVPARKVKVIPNFLRALPHPPAHQDREALIVGIGRLCRQKGFDVLISAFAASR